VHATFFFLPSDKQFVLIGEQEVLYSIFYIYTHTQKNLLNMWLRNYKVKNLTPSNSHLSFPFSLVDDYIFSYKQHHVIVKIILARLHIIFFLQKTRLQHFIHVYIFPHAYIYFFFYVFKKGLQAHLFTQKRKKEVESISFPCMHAQLDKV